MALVEGTVATAAQDSGYEAAKRRARNVASGQATTTDTSKSVFDVRSRKLLYGLVLQALGLLSVELCSCIHP